MEHVTKGDRMTSAIGEKVLAARQAFENAKELIDHAAKVLDELEPATLFERLRVWDAYRSAKDLLKVITEPEMTLRKTIFAEAFPEAVENTNTLELGEGWKLKANNKYTRVIDESTLTGTLAELREMKVNTDLLVENKPVLDMKMYRLLTAEQHQVLSQSVTTKPAAPELELVAPKEKK